MGLFSKLKEMSKESENTVYALLKKKLIADGEEHILQKEISVIVSDKQISEFPEYMKTQGFEVLDYDIMPSAIKNMKQIKVKYRSTK